MEGTSPIHLLQETVSSSGAYWLPRFSLYFCQQCLKGLSETWGTEFTSNHAIMQTSLQLHIQSKHKNHKYTCEGIAFADDSTLIAHSAVEIQRIVDAFANSSSKFGLKINIKKTEVMFHPNSTMTMEEDINVDETTLNHVKELTYIGSIIASNGHIEAELQKRISKARMSFGRLRERLWNNHNVSIRVKIKSTVRSYCPPYRTGLRYGRCIGGL